MTLNDFLSQIQYVTKGKYGAADLLSDDFLLTFTEFENAKAMLLSIPFDLDEKLIQGSISESELNEFITYHSDFTSWKALLFAAVAHIEK